MESFAIGPLNKVRRTDRGYYDREAILAVLKEGLVAHVGFIIDDWPVVMPMVYGVGEDCIYIHGAKAARFAKAMGPGVPVCITVTLTDAIVVGRSAFHCSMNYRSVVIHGHAKLVTDPAVAEEALAVVTDHLLGGFRGRTSLVAYSGANLFELRFRGFRGNIQASFHSVGRPRRQVGQVLGHSGRPSLSLA